MFAGNGGVYKFFRTILLRESKELYLEDVDFEKGSQHWKVHFTFGYELVNT